MGTITANEILRRARKTLNDDNSVRWTEAELIDWLNDAQREIVVYRPDASVVEEDYGLVGGTRQELPAAGLRLLDIVRNSGSNRAVRQVPRYVLDTTRPDWHTEQGSDVKHFVFDERVPRVFYVYPGVENGHQVRVAYSVAPAPIQNGESVIAVDDTYAGALLDYVLYRAYSKDAEFSANAERAGGYFQAFMMGIAAKVQGDESQPAANWMAVSGSPTLMKGT